MLAYMQRVAVAETGPNPNTNCRSRRVSKDSQLDVNSVLQSRVHRSEVWRRRFGSSPKISTTVENIVENVVLYLSSTKSLCFLGVFCVCRFEPAEFSRVPGLSDAR